MVIQSQQQQLDKFEVQSMAYNYAVCDQFDADVLCCAVRSWVPGAPTPRYAHTMASVGQRLVVCAGKGYAKEDIPNVEMLGGDDEPRP